MRVLSYSPEGRRLQDSTAVVSQILLTARQCYFCDSTVVVESFDSIFRSFNYTNPYMWSCPACQRLNSIKLKESERLIFTNAYDDYKQKLRDAKEAQELKKEQDARNKKVLTIVVAIAVVIFVLLFPIIFL